MPFWITDNHKGSYVKGGDLEGRVQYTEEGAPWLHLSKEAAEVAKIPLNVLACVLRANGYEVSGD